MPNPTFYNLPPEKRELITTVAIDEFYEKGYEKTSIAKIIDKAKIPRGSFYQYFEDKNDLYRYLIIEVIGARKHQYSAHLSNLKELSFFDYIRHLFLSGIQFYRDYPKLASIAIDFMSIRDKELRIIILGESQKKADDYFIQYINERKDDGEIVNSLDTSTLVYFIHSMNQTLANFFLDHGKTFEDDHLVQQVNNMISILENGIKPLEGENIGKNEEI
ncbi:TetR/AcrR family transcriptional regulator [Bacillus sp. 31A1R]|uniref:TetR/AcrR family transcriptional regulator n=1 Tax=Robertmurraya mangrovi TaxID=3098077 RepID=A0ABU5J096_9BACI|nr:TetR/AcrR family transcriptional regulator [Bacillus sp. 31A1R]MDZ5472821.1 TetR/AcrR family transcriptional regulator [Bacillus sp. 31A1R]